jgi:hypothetical protein
MRVEYVVIDDRGLMIDGRLAGGWGRPPIIDHQLSITDHPSSITDHQLSITIRQSPIANESTIPNPQSPML